MSRISRRNSGFTMVEIMFSMLILGAVLVSLLGIFTLFQKSSSQTRQFADTQQNTRVAIDYITEYLRQAGSATDYVRGQRFIVHAAPYQVGFNADIDFGQTIGGEAPLVSIDRAASPNTVPVSGTTIYTPPRDFQSDAETMVFTLDSNSDGVVSSADQGDDPEEGSTNPNVYLLRRDVYGSNGAGSNVMRTTNLALLRGPGQAPDNSYPQPLFQYFYDHDDDPDTPEKLWGDDSPEDGELNDAEIASLTAMPDALLPGIRKVKVTVLGESSTYNSKFEDNGGFLRVEMQSEVYVRNATRTGSTIFGKVFNDTNGDGIYDVGETGLPNVEVRLVGYNRRVYTSSAGVFFFPVKAGDFTVREYDPAGYSSTTTNVQSVTVAPGAAVQVDFGDQSAGPIGYIKGKVFDDFDQDGLFGGSDVGIQDVAISLDSGEDITTDANGDYMFTMPLGTYNVVETDPPGYASTTPNAVEADIAAAGDTVTVNFGDNSSVVFGTIEGYVFLDEDQNGIFDSGESGVASATLTLSSSDSALTNNAGFYQLSVPPGVYDITERDPPGYTSTTVNNVTGIVIVADTVVTIDFGDMLIEQDNFIELIVTNIPRVMSVDAVDLGEDNKGDADIIVGTPYATGTGNLLVFHNERRNASTALSAFFSGAPDYQRNAGNNINTLATYDFSGGGGADVMSGLHFNTGTNVQLWYNGAKGVLSTSPDVAFSSAGAQYVLDSELVDLDRDGHMDMILGLTSGLGTYSGAFEVFRGGGGGSFSSWDYVYAAGQSGTLLLGEVWALDTGDIDGDGDADVVVGTKSNYYSGYVDVFLNTGSGDLSWDSRYFVPGAVNVLRLDDMAEDNLGDPDLLVGTSTASNIGLLLLYENNGGVFGKDSGNDYGTEVRRKDPDDAFAPGGEVLSLEASDFNGDVFPDLLVGTRSSLFYQGDLYFLPTYGALPSSGQPLNDSVMGEVVSMALSDFDKDNRPDVLVGTRTTSMQGRLLIYFYRQ